MCGIPFSNGKDNTSLGNPTLGIGINDPQYQVNHASELEGINSRILLSCPVAGLDTE